MGQIGFAIGGAVVGAVGGLFLGQPLAGAALGFALGNTLGSVIYGTRKADMGLDGPRLGDNTVQSSTFGATIPKVYGRWRLAGNLIWTTGIFDKANPPVDANETSGKGGGLGHRENDPVFVASLAIALAEGPILGIVRVWADGMLIYDKSGTNPVGHPQYVNTMTVYLGSESQSWDPTIAAGAGGSVNTPGFRGTAYVVFKEFPLLEFGNRIPNFTFEVLSVDSTNYPYTSVEPTVDAPLDDLLVHPVTGELFMLSSSGYITVVRRGGTIRKQRDILQAIANRGGLSRASYSITSKLFVIGSGSDLWLAVKTTGGDGFLVRIDPQTVMPNFDSMSVNAYVNGMEIAEGIAFQGANGTTIYTADSVGGAIRKWTLDTDDETMSMAWERQGPSATCQPGNFTVAYNRFFLLSFEPGANPGDDNKFYVTYFNTGGNTWHTTYSGNGRCRAILGHYSATANPFLLVGANNQSLFVKIPLPTSNSVPLGSSVTTFAAAHAANQRSAFANYYPNASGFFWYVVDATNISRFKLDGTAAIDKTVAIGNWSGVTGGFLTGAAFDPTADILWVMDSTGDLTVRALKLNRQGITTISLGDIVADICSKAGLEASEYDVSALNSTLVNGYCITRQMPAREALRPLAQAFMFEAVESDDKIKFVKRGGTAVFPFDGYLEGAADFSIVERDLGTTEWGGEMGEKLARQRLPDNELPRRVTVGYLNPDRDYNEASQFEQLYEDTIGTDNQVTLELPLACSDTFARELAEKLLYAAWTERESYEFTVPLRYIVLDPTDVISVSADGLQYELRITHAQLGANNIIEMKAALEDAAVYTAVGTQESTAITPPTIDIPSPTRLHPLDIPLLRDNDNGPGWYLTASRLIDEGTWRGATLMKSEEGTGFSAAGSLTSEVVFGVVDTPLEMPSSQFKNSFDYRYTFRVRLYSGALSSDTELNVLNGANTLCIGNGDDAEILQFVNATQIEDDLYELDGLLRGRRGTERSIIFGGVGLPVVLIDIDSMQRVTPHKNEINTRRVLRAKTFGLPAHKAPHREFLHKAVGLKPYHTIQCTIVRDGSNNFTIDWIPRTRIGGEWNDYVDAPVGEAEEEYEVEFRDTPPNHIDDSVPALRTKTVTTPSTTYTAAEQVEDTGAIIAGQVYVTIYKMSAVVGRGYPGDFKEP
jgi:hypothetical protein